MVNGEKYVIHTNADTIVFAADVCTDVVAGVEEDDFWSSRKNVTDGDVAQVVDDSMVERNASWIINYKDTLWYL